MLRIICLIYFGLFFKTAKSQLLLFDWAKVFVSSVNHNLNHGSNGRSIAVDQQGNVFSAGFFSGTVDFDPGPGVFNLTAGGYDNYGIYISKLNSLGNFVWAKQIPLYVIGREIEIKLDAGGNVFLTSNLDFPADMDPGPGIQLLTPVGSTEVFIVKWDNNGDYVWAKQFMANGPGSRSDVKNFDIDLDGNVAICGSYTGVIDFDPGPGSFYFTSANNSGGFLTKLTGNGDFVWAKRFGNNGTVTGGMGFGDLKFDASGNLYSSGELSGLCDFDPGPGTYELQGRLTGDGYVFRVDKDGNLLWAKKIGGSTINASIIPRGIDIDNNNNMISTGTFHGAIDFNPGSDVYTLTSNSATADVYVLKLNVMGELMWAKGIGGDSNDTGNDITVDDAGNVYIISMFRGTVDLDPGTGVFPFFSIKEQMVLSKFNAGGIFSHAYIFTNLFSWSNLARRLVTDPAHNIFISGFISGSTDFDPGPNDYILNSGSTISPFVVKLSKCTNITTSTLHITTCTSYTLNNVEFDSTGIYIQVIPNSTNCDSVITLNLTINRKFTSVNAIICEGETYNAGGTSQTISGIYKDTLLTTLGCDSIITTYLKVNPKPRPDLGPDGNLCTNAQASITPGSFNSYLWQDNSTLPAFTVNNPGNYWVTVTDANNCTATDTLHILSIDTLPNNFLPPNQELCYGNSLKIEVPGYADYLWSTGSTADHISLNTFGSFYLTVTDHNQCTGTDTIHLQRKNCFLIGIPNAFTPNGDGKNDIFKPTIFLEVKAFSFELFNRFGQKVFETREYGKGWDGNFKGKEQPSCSYVYRIKFTNIFGWETVENGTVILIR